MATARYAWGIDIGNRALKAIRLVRAGDGVRIDDFDVIEHEQILSQAGDNRDALMQASISAFVQKHSLKSSTVAVGVSGQSSFARFIKLPPVERKQIPNIVRFEAIQQIPFPLDDVEWAYQLFETPGSPDIEVGIFAMRKELVAKHIQLFTDADMNVSAVQMNPLADYNAMQFDGRLKETTMIIDMGAETTDLIIADNDFVWLRSIPIGGNSFTEALVKAFKLNFVKAEELKRTAGTSKYTRQIFQAMRPIFGDLVSEIQRSMGFFSSVRRETRIKRIIALGGTFRLPNLLRYLQQNLQLDVERMDSFRGGVPSDPKLAATFNENMLSLAGAYGLALQAMGETKITSSLLPGHIRRERMWKDKTKWFGLAAASMLAGSAVALGSVYIAKNVSGSDELKSKNDSVLATAQRLSQQWSTVESAGQEDVKAIRDLYGLTDYRMLWPNLLTDLRGAVPSPDASLASGLMNWDAATVTKVPRDQRKYLVLYDISTQYIPDISAAIAPGTNLKSFAPGGVGGGGGAPMMMGAPMAAAGADSSAGGGGGGGAAKGFMLTLKCSTPFKNGPLLVQSEFINNLLKINYGSEDGKRYVVANASIISQNRLANNAARLKDISDQHSALRDEGSVAKVVRTPRASRTAARGPVGPMGPGSGGMPMMGGPSPEQMAQILAQAQAAQAAAMRGAGGPPGVIPGRPVRPGAAKTENAEDAAKVPDPLTGEDVRQDWDFVVMCAVVVDPSADLLAKFAKPTTAPTDAAAAEGQAK